MKMSLLRCCTGGKRRRGPKTNAKSPPPIDRHEVLLEQTSFSNLDTRPTQPAVLSSFRMRVATNGNHVEDVDPILVAKAREPDSDIDHTSLDQILANLLSDISSPSFQRTSDFQVVASGSEKTENGVSIRSSTSGFPSCGANGHYRSQIDHNANAFGGNVFSYEPSSIDDDYDVPCGASDEGDANREQGDYDFPPTPTSCSVSAFPPSVATNGSPAGVVIDGSTDDYDRPRTFRDGGGIVIPASSSIDDVKTSTTVATSDVRESSKKPELPVGHSAASTDSNTAASIKQTAVVVNNDSLVVSSGGSTSGTTSEKRQRQSLMEQFKTVRLGVLMSMSQLLMCVGGGDNDVSAKVTNVIQLSSSLKLSLSKFVEFLRLLLSRASDDDNNIVAHHIDTLISIRNGLDEYVEDINATVERNETTNAGLKLAGVMHVTKELPALLRAFVPLVERVQTSAQAEERARQSVSESARLQQVVAVDELPPPVSSRVNSREDRVENTDSDKNQTIKCFPSDKIDTDVPNDSTENGRKIAAVEGHESLSSRGAFIIEPSPSIARPPVPPKQRRADDLFGNVTDANTASPKSSVYEVPLPKDSVDGSLRITAPPPSSVNDRLLSVSQTDVSASNPSCEPAVLRRKPLAQGSSSAAATDDDSGCISQSELETPSVRASGVSQTTVDQLEELRRQADSQLVRVHSDFTQFVGDDFDAVSLSSAGMNYVTPLSNNDRRLLMFYCGQVNNNWSVLDNAAAAFFRCMERKQSPKVFVTHGKFVILAGHKLTYIGGIMARNIEDEKAQDYIVAYSNSLCSSLKVAVRATKEAALKYPDVGAQQSMVDSIKEVTDWAIELKEVIDRLTYLGHADSFL